MMKFLAPDGADDETNAQSESDEFPMSYFQG